MLSLHPIKIQPELKKFGYLEFMFIQKSLLYDNMTFNKRIFKLRDENLLGCVKLITVFVVSAFLNELLAISGLV